MVSPAGAGGILHTPGLDVQEQPGRNRHDDPQQYAQPVAGARSRPGRRSGLPGGASLTGTRLTFQGGGSVMVSGTDALARLLNHATIDYDLTRRPHPCRSAVI